MENYTVTHIEEDKNLQSNRKRKTRSCHAREEAEESTKNYVVPHSRVDGGLRSNEERKARSCHTHYRNTIGYDY